MWGQNVFASLGAAIFIPTYCVTMLSFVFPEYAAILIPVVAFILPPFSHLSLEHTGGLRISLILPLSSRRVNLHLWAYLMGPAVMAVTVELILLLFMRGLTFSGAGHVALLSLTVALISALAPISFRSGSVAMLGLMALAAIHIASSGANHLSAAIVALLLLLLNRDLLGAFKKNAPVPTLGFMTMAALLYIFAHSYFYRVIPNLALHYIPDFGIALTIVSDAWLKQTNAVETALRHPWYSKRINLFMWAYRLGPAFIAVAAELGYLLVWNRLTYPEAAQIALACMAGAINCGHAVILYRKGSTRLRNMAIAACFLSGSATFWIELLYATIVMSLLLFLINKEQLSAYKSDVTEQAKPLHSDPPSFGSLKLSRVRPFLPPLEYLLFFFVWAVLFRSPFLAVFAAILTCRAIIDDCMPRILRILPLSHARRLLLLNLRLLITCLLLYVTYICSRSENALNSFSSLNLTLLVYGATSIFLGFKSLEISNMPFFLVTVAVIAASSGDLASGHYKTYEQVIVAYDKLFGSVTLAMGALALIGAGVFMQYQGLGTPARK